MEVSVSGGNPFCAFPACLLSGTVFSGAADWRRYECILPACAYADWSDRDSGCSSLHIVVSGRFSRRKETGILYPAADRHLPVPEILGFLVIGAFLGQYGNILVGLFQQYLNPEAYQELSPDFRGESIWSLIFWMGIAAPFAEEVIFRWLVFLRMRDNMRVITAALFSGLTFGIYHMNLLQGVYATIMGLLFALILEWRGNLFASVFLHMGANIWSLLVSDVMLYMLDHTGATSVIALNLFLVFAGTYGIWRCYKNYQKRGCTS